MKRHVVAVIVSSALLAASIPFVTVPFVTVAQAAGLGADIREGTCEQPGGVVADLQPPVVAEGQTRGAKDAVGAATSFTPAPLILDELLATDHVVTLSSGNDVVACGGIGGTLEDDGSLGIVLRTSKGGGPSGVAYFQATGNVSLFVDPGKTNRTASDAHETPTTDIGSGGVETPTTDNGGDQAAATGAVQEKDGLTLEYSGPGPRSGSYAGFAVRIGNTKDSDATNPQTELVVKLGGEDWACQGYYDPVTGEPRTGVFDVVGQPLVVSAGEQVDVTILCRIPDAPLDTAQLQFR
jgi:hypothetical protein